MNDVIKTIKPKQHLNEHDQALNDYLEINNTLRSIIADTERALIAVDTSGSTPQRVIDLLPYLAEIPEEDDELITFTTSVTPYDPDKPNDIAQGGTDYSPVHQYAKGKKFDAIIVITDGDAYFSGSVYENRHTRVVGLPSAKKLKKKWHWLTPAERPYGRDYDVYDEKVQQNIYPIVTAYGKH